MERGGPLSTPFSKQGRRGRSTDGLTDHTGQLDDDVGEFSAGMIDGRGGVPDGEDEAAVEVDEQSEGGATVERDEENADAVPDGDGDDEQEKPDDEVQRLGGVSKAGSGVLDWLTMQAYRAFEALEERFSTRLCMHPVADRLTTQL